MTEEEKNLILKDSTELRNFFESRGYNVIISNIDNHLAMYRITFIQKEIFTDAEMLIINDLVFLIARRLHLVIFISFEHNI